MIEHYKYNKKYMGKIKQFIYCKTFGLHEWDFTQMPTHIEYPKDVFRVELRSNVYCTKCNKRMEVCDTYERDAMI